MKSWNEILWVSYVDVNSIVSVFILWLDKMFTCYQEKIIYFQISKFISERCISSSLSFVLESAFGF